MSMAPAVESTDTDVFHRSHSSPDVLRQAALPSNHSSNHIQPTRSTHIFDNLRHTVGSAHTTSESSHTLSLPSPSRASPSSYTGSLPSSSLNPSASYSTRPDVAAGSASTLLPSASTPSLTTCGPLSSSFTTTSVSSPSLSSSAGQEPTTQSAFEVPSFDFHVDFDSGLEFSLVKKPQQPKPDSPPAPRRVWEEFIKKDDTANTTGVANKENEASPCASNFGAELDAYFGPSASGSNTGNIRLTRSPLDFASANDSSFVTNEACMKRPATAVAPSAKQLSLEREQELAGADKFARRLSIVERPLSWIPGTRSAPDFQDLLAKEREKEARKAKQTHLAPPTKSSKTGSFFQRPAKDEKIAASTATATAIPSEAEALPSDGARMGERSKSFVDFAKRSWISRSPSPSPSSSPSRKQASKREKEEEKKREKERAKERAKEAKEEKERGRLAKRRTIFGSSGSNSSLNLQDESNDAKPSSVTAAAPAVLAPTAAEVRRHSTSATSASEAASLVGNVTTAAPTGESGRDSVESASSAPQSISDAPAAGSEPISIVVVPPVPAAPTSRTFGRASEYLSRIKQRPQSMFVKAVANSTSSKLSGDDTVDDLFILDDANTGRNSTSSPLSLSLELLSDKSLKPSRGNARKPGEVSASTSSANSDDGSSDGSANGSALLPGSEAESLTTADTSNHNPMAHLSSRDPHWVAFKDLETNFFKFLSKNTTAQRMIIVRATLAPFLRRYINDAVGKNNSQLSAEDVERRASILNRWWTGLLEMLDAPAQYQGNNSASQSGGLFGTGTFFGTSTTVNGNFTPVSGIDRPVVLECVSLIMSRPEWRLLTDVFRPYNDRPHDRSDSSGSNTPAESPVDDSSIFVEESAEHNVRTMFVNNLLAQLILVVDKMSMRQAPLSVVNFSGKACAYAFFFVPGVSDILVRLWGVQTKIELVRRFVDAVGLPRRSRSRADSDEIVSKFPPCLSSLAWNSVMTCQADLRKPPKMSLLPPAYVSACMRVSWFAPCWVSRWKGVDTDLLFVFAKYFHILANDFMPPSLNLTLPQRARAPGFVLLHAQLLQVFDNTIHRQAAMEAAMLMAGGSMGDNSPTLWTQQQLLQKQKQPYMTTTDDLSLGGGPPGTIQTSNNLFREMEENRIIALLRDFLESDETVAGARNTFAETSMVLLRASTLRTSQYDHNACSILCDFLQEMLQTFDNYYGYRSRRDSVDSMELRQPIDFIDWTFWLDVCKKMLNSNNTMSEIRVLSFVFATWDLVAADPVRKEQLCTGWLLTEDVFDKFFNNWCPMVRAYYMRVLCWRICRDSGSSTELDASIFLLVSQRLKTAWAKYLWLKQEAETKDTPLPSTAPSLPQPGKRLLIVRVEINGPQLGLLANPGNVANSFGQPGANTRTATTFDALSGSVAGISPLSSGSFRSPDSDTASISSLSSLGDDKKEGAKKKWSLFGKVLGISAKTPTEEDFEEMRHETAVSRAAAKAGSSMPFKSSRLGSPSSDSGSSTGSAPVFDASQFVFRFMLRPIPQQGSVDNQGDIILPPAYRERVLTRPRLPAPAQMCISAQPSVGSRTESPTPSANRPPASRRLSGLISDARNASFISKGPRSERSDSSSSGRPSFGHQRRDSLPLLNQGLAPAVQALPRSASASLLSEAELERERASVQPVEPVGSEGKLRAKYAGRALAEWSLVVNECNTFVDRRRDEGVYGLKDVEVPTLSVEGMRRLA